VIGEPNGGHLELGGAGRKRGNPAGTIEDGVLGVDVKVDEGRFRHGKPILVGRSAGAPPTKQSPSV